MLKLISDQKEHWQTALIQAVTDPKVLLDLLELDSSLLNDAKAAAKLFPLKVPLGFVARMEKGNLNDPLLKQVLPIGAEFSEVPNYVKDPLGENKVNPVPGLLHKYQGRVLLTPTSACAIHCRYCFRRHFPYAANNPGKSGWALALDYIAKDSSIHEVILSGGDPLIMNDKQLEEFGEKLSQIPHLKRLRIHSRLPIVLPERITKTLLNWLKKLPLQTILVIHCNHPNEIDHTVTDALRALREHEVTLLNQTVLLKSVNDNVKTLVALSEALFATHVLPYYLHVLDKVEGTAHFDLPLAKAQELHRLMSHQLPGYLVPRLVMEKAGALAKISVENPDFYTGE